MAGCTSRRSDRAGRLEVVADLHAGDPGAIEEALVAVWELQRAAD